jgi:hypothetical protein
MKKKPTTSQVKKEATPRRTGRFMYIVIAPDGEELWWTLSDYMERAWIEGGFDHAGKTFGEAYRVKYWHKLTPSLNYAKRRGYTFKKFELVEVELKKEMK